MNTQIQSLVRRYGYGVPDVERALLSTRNDLTLIVQDELQPFQREGTAAAKTRDMKLHRLPWPKDELAAAGDAQVELRVLLSYFVERNPGERSWTRRHRYAWRLRFRVKHATESVDEFRARINQAAREEEGVRLVGVAKTGCAAPSATADLSMRISGLEALRIWPSVRLSACSPLAGGGRKNPTWSASMRWRDTLWS